MDLETSIQNYESSVRRYRFMYIAVDFIATFFTLYIIFSLFNMKDIFSIIPTFEPYTGKKYSFLGFKVVFETLVISFIELFFAGLITGIRYRRKEKKGAIKLIEEKFPILKERLGTAYDNRKEDNIIVKDLIESVGTGLKLIKPSELLNKKLLKIGIAAVLLTSLTSVYITAQDVHTEISPKDLSEVIENIPFISGNSDNSAEEEGGTSEDKQSGEDIFGEPSIIVVEGTEVDLTIPTGTEMGSTSMEEGEKRDEAFVQSETYDPEAIASQSYYENLPEGYKNVIQNYFEELAED